jgi:hypothetical protein
MKYILCIAGRCRLLAALFSRCQVLSGLRRKLIVVNPQRTTVCMPHESSPEFASPLHLAMCPKKPQTPPAYRIPRPASPSRYAADAVPHSMALIECPTAMPASDSVWTSGAIKGSSISREKFPVGQLSREYRRLRLVYWRGYCGALRYARAIGNEGGISRRAAQ